MLEILFAAALALAPAQTLSRLPAPEANQGVPVDGAFVYAVGNSEIGKYDRATGQQVAKWTGDPATFPHLNSCAVIGAELVCASSNYPATPMASTVEVFDPVTMVHVRSQPLGRQPGSLTWVDRREGAWWAGFANYDGRGGEPGRDHRFTTVPALRRPLARHRRLDVSEDGSGAVQAAQLVRRRLGRGRPPLCDRPRPPGGLRPGNPPHRQ